MNSPIICMVTIHGIGFEQPPQGNLPGYADDLHEHLHERLGKILSDDPDRDHDHEIGSWRVTTSPEGLARVMETDSPRSRTLAVSTFPTPLSRTGLAGFRASGSPEKTSPGWRIRKGLRISRPANFIHFDVFLLPPFALCAAFQRSLVGRDSYDYYNGSVTMRLAACRSSRIPSMWYVLARCRYPIHPLQ